MHKYKLKYNLKTTVGNFTKEELLADRTDDMGATDALFVGSLIFPSDGSFSFNHFSSDGRKNGEQLDSNDLFRVWLCLGSHLGSRCELDEGREKIVKQAMEGFIKYCNAVSN